MVPEDPFLNTICLGTTSFQFRLGFGSISGKCNPTTD
jgi:hypothetical protein